MRSALHPPPRASRTPSWYLLVHQLPPTPLYLRAKIRQRLARIGAVPLKNAVYALPFREECLADLRAVAAEAVEGGGEAHVFAAEFVELQSDEALIQRFREEREAAYASLAASLRERGPATPARVAGARRRLNEIARTDFFQAPGRRSAETLLARLEAPRDTAGARRPGGPAERRPGRTWVTRRGVHVDRIASAWLIRRFLDPRPHFRFVDPADPPREGELRFDMVGGDYSHEGDACTFETLIARNGMADPPLAQVAEIVHDIDLKDGKFGRTEARGVEQVLLGLLLAHPKDEERLERGFALFDQLYESFRRKAKPREASR